MNALISANDTNFETYLKEQSALIVDFWSPTCQPCIQMEPGLKKIATDYNGKVKVLKVNVNDCPKTSSRFFVRGLPTLLFIKDGRVQQQMVGTVSARQIEQILQKVI